MYNYTTTALVLLVRMKLLTPAAGKYLSDNLQSKIHTSRYNDSFAMVDEMLRELEAKDEDVLMQPWMAHIKQLEKRVDDLTKQVKVLQSKK